MKDVNLTELDAILLKSDVVTVILFGAYWSAPSKSVSSILFELELISKDVSQFVSLDIYHNHDASKKFDIQGCTYCLFLQER